MILDRKERSCWGGGGEDVESCPPVPGDKGDCGEGEGMRILSALRGGKIDMM